MRFALFLFFGCFSLVRAIVTTEELLAQFDERARPTAQKILDRIKKEEGKPVPHEANKTQFGTHFLHSPETLIHMLRHCKGKRVLELGGGTGNHALLLLLAGAQEVVANDISEPALEGLKACYREVVKPLKGELNLGNLFTLEGDCLKILSDLNGRLKQGPFDVILVRNLLHFFSEPKIRKIVSEIYKVSAENCLLNITFLSGQRYAHQDESIRLGLEQHHVVTLRYLRFWTALCPENIIDEYIFTEDIKFQLPEKDFHLNLTDFPVAKANPKLIKHFLIKNCGVTADQASFIGDWFKAEKTQKIYEEYKNMVGKKENGELNDLSINILISDRAFCGPQFLVTLFKEQFNPDMVGHIYEHKGEEVQDHFHPVGASLNLEELIDPYGTLSEVLLRKRASALAS